MKRGEKIGDARTETEGEEGAIGEGGRGVEDEARSMWVSVGNLSMGYTER